MSFAEIHCPVCGAEPHQRCTAGDGSSVLGGAHAARVSAAHERMSTMTNKTITVNVIEIKRLDMSANGNPRYALIADDGKTYRTKADAGCAYTVSPTPRVEGFSRTYGLTLDGRGSVIGIEEA